MIHIIIVSDYILTHMLVFLKHLQIQSYFSKINYFIYIYIYDR